MRVIIVGGGIAGATLALAISTLTRGRLAVDLVEAVEPKDQLHPGFDARAIALAQGTCQQFERLGIWSALADCATAIKVVHVSDQGHAGMTQLDARDYALPALGQVVELYDVGQRLFCLLRQAAGVTLHCPATVTQIVREEHSVSVTLNNGQQLQAHLLVAADGSPSVVSQACQIAVQQTSYEQVAIIANVATELAHQGKAFERFTAQGPLALLPMSHGRSSLVWCHAIDHQDEVMSWSDSQFLSQLQEAFGWRLGQLRHVGSRNSYPLRLRRATRHVSHRVALVGNAAQTLHPIAGQGFNLGLRDVMSLAETVAEALKEQLDVGSYAVLSRYQQRRIPDQQATIRLTDGLVSGFSNQDFPLVVGRNLGLWALSGIPLLREFFAHRSLGWVER